jgi:hypothetical protein
MKREFLTKKRLWLLAIWIVAGFYLGAVSGSSSMMVRLIVGVVMGGIVSWLVSGFLK